MLIILLYNITTGGHMVIIDKLPSNIAINTIILDIDGTITRWKNVQQFLEKSLHILGIPYCDDALQGLFQAMKYRELHALTTGEADENVYSMFLEYYIKILREYGVSGNDLKNVMFELEASETYISDETQEELKNLAECYPLIAYTNWFYHQSIKKLDRYDLTKYFRAIHSSEDNFVKYSRMGFLRLLEMYHLDASKTVHIGDSESDIVPSKKANLYSIYLDYVLTSGDDITEKKMKLINMADASITEFRDIRRVLKK